MNRVCDRCHGRGTVPLDIRLGAPTAPCRSCNGVGVVPVETTGYERKPEVTVATETYVRLSDGTHRTLFLMSDGTVRWRS